MKTVPSICLLLLAAPLSCSAFVISSPNRNAMTQNSMLPAETTNWIATIDADIANISDNEFAPVFMGGIAVMFGGLLSATIVGFILEKGDLYANVVADSYIQQQNGNGGNDEEFWAGLTEEETIKGREILRQLEAKKRGEIPQDTPITMDGLSSAGGGNKSPEEPVAPDTPAKEKDMFSDY